MKEVALVLGGGGARGLAHVHVLEAFDDLGVRPCVIAGSSIGALVGAAYAAGMSGAEIREYMLRILADRGQVMGRLWQLRPGSIRAAFTETFQRFGELNAQKVLKAFMPEQIPGTFEELAIPLKTTSTDFYGNSMTVIDSGPLLPAIAASIAIPAIFKPEIVNGRVHIDGGIANPVAFDLVEAPGRIVVAVDVIGAPRGDDPSRIPSRMETAFGASQLLMHSVIRMKLQLHKPDLLVRPAVSQFRVLDFLHARAIIEHTTPTRVEARTKLARLLETADA